jgi:hypothetical protein
MLRGSVASLYVVLVCISSAYPVRASDVAAKDTLRAPPSVLRDVGGPACGSGPTIVTFVQLYRCVSGDCNGVFSNGRTFRVERTSTRFRPDVLRRMLAHLSGRPEGDFAGGVTLSNVANGPATAAYKTHAGSGLVLAAHRAGRGVSASVCRLDRDAVTESLADAVLSNHDLLIFRLELDGIPHAAVMRSVAVSRKRADTELQSIHKGLGAINTNNPVILAVAAMPQGAAACLGDSTAALGQ